MKRCPMILLSALLLAFVLGGSVPTGFAELPEASGEEEVKTLRILATSDLHGKFMPWDYALDEASTSGSMTQLAAAIAEYRTDATLLVDAGDTIQDNSADLFVGDGIHPMVQALNVIGYDVWVTGNHEYNYGMDVLRDTIADVQANTLVGNVYDENGDPLADGYTILERDGIRIAVIGMVTPSIVHFDPINLAECTVTDPLDETRKIIDAIQGQYDVLVGVFHMGLNNEYDKPNSGVTDILNACPEFDVMVASHSHKEIPGQYINNVLTVMNRNMAQTMAVIDLTLEKDGDGWRVADRSSRIVKIADYEPDPALTELLAPYDERARQEAETVIGELVGGPLAPENEIADIPTALIEDTALLDLVNEVQLYYSGADVAMASIFTKDDNLQPGAIRRCDIAQIYGASNMLYTLRMTGAQLRDYLEFNARYYNTFRPGDLTISFNPTMRFYLNDILEGVNYEINIGREPGNRIENLTWPDGTPVKDDDEFTMALSDYRANACLLVPGMVYEEDNLPVLLDIDVRSDLGSIREMIVDYIRNVKDGIITPDCNHNWRLTGCEWDEDLHALAVRLLAEGKLSIPTTADARCINPVPITVSDLPEEAVAAYFATEAEEA